MAVSLIAGLAAAGIGAYQAINSSQKKKKADEEVKRNMANRPMQTTPESLKKQVQLAQSRLNATNPALLAAYQQAQQQQANSNSFAQRNATSGAQALNAASQSQAQTQALLPQLSQAQTQFQQQNLANYNQSLGLLTDDARLRTEDAQAANSDLTNFNLGQVGAASQGISSGIGLAAGGLASAAGAYSNRQNLGGISRQQQRFMNKRDLEVYGTPNLMPANSTPQPLYNSYPRQGIYGNPYGY